MAEMVPNAAMCPKCRKATDLRAASIDGWYCPGCRQDMPWEQFPFVAEFKGDAIAVTDDMMKELVDAGAKIDPGTFRD